MSDSRVVFDRRSATCSKGAMVKILSLLVVAMMIVHIIRPLGLPGLRRRADFWKLALFALASISLTVALSHFA
jgi:hypothetical protein